VLARLLSNVDGYRMTADDLAREAPDGRHSVLSALRELREAGYLVTVRVQGEKGRFRTETYVFDFPQDTTSLKVQKTDVRSPDVGSPDVGSPNVGRTNSIQVYQQENQQQHQAAAAPRAHAREPAPALPGGGAAAAPQSSSTPTPSPAGGQQGKRRGRRGSGIVTWYDSDIQEAERIELQHDPEDIKQAVKSLENQCLEPVPGRVEKELERLVRAREAARRQEQIMTMASQPSFDPVAKAKGDAILSKIRARQKEREAHEASL
jgi:hypothetical protein